MSRAGIARSVLAVPVMVCRAPARLGKVCYGGHVAFRLGLVRFDWASLGKAVRVRLDVLCLSKSRRGGLGAVRSGTASRGEVSQGGLGTVCYD